MTDEILYRTIGAELEGTKDAAAWAQALAEANGDPARTEAAYVRLRLQALKKAAISAAVQRIDNSQKDGVAAIRSTLAAALPVSRASNFYQALGVRADASDETIQQAIEVLEAEIAREGGVRSPLFNYAKETLGNPQQRELYDRKLYDQLRAPEQGTRAAQPMEDVVRAEGVFLPWWGTRKVAVIIGTVIVAVLGYMLLAFTKEHGGREIQRASIEVQKASIDAQREQMRAAAENERARVNNDRVAAEAQISVIDKAVDRSAELQNRALSIAESEQQRRQQELEYRANAGSQLLELERERQRHQIAMERERQRAQDERLQQIRAQRERQYWACMNAAIDRVGSAEASARCSVYR